MNDTFEEQPPLRSLLFVPGNRPDWVSKAVASGADALVLDLEDAVPDESKVIARAVVGEIIAEWADRIPLFVRINRLDSRDSLTELEMVVQSGLRGVVLPKIESAEDVIIASRLLDWFERDRGILRGSVSIIPLLETAAAIRDAYALGRASDRVAYLGGLSAKGGDVERSVGYRWTREGRETLTFRAQVLLEVRAAGVSNPVTGLWTDLRDLDGLRSFAEENRELGYEGMMVIHPSHVAVVNEVFSPTPEELAYYEGLVAAVDAAARSGSSAVSFQGEMVDTAMVTTARERLSRFRKN